MPSDRRRRTHRSAAVSARRRASPIRPGFASAGGMVTSGAKGQRESRPVIGHVCALTIVGGLVLATSCANSALAEKAGGILKISFFDNPASMSLLEEATGAALRPMMGVFNNLV